MILGIDCSQGLNLIFFDKKNLIYQYKNHNIKNASEILVLKIENCLNKINKNYSHLSKIIIVNGPGSFTGIRCAVTFAKIMKISLSIPIYGFSKFELANFFYYKKLKNKNIKKRIFLQYKENDFFYAAFNENKLIADPEIINISKFNFNDYSKDLFICDNNIILDYFQIDKNAQKFTSVSIFNYKLDHIMDLNAQSFQKKYIPRPIYVKNFF